MFFTEASPFLYFLSSSLCYFDILSVKLIYFLKPGSYNLDWVFLLYILSKSSLIDFHRQITFQSYFLDDSLKEAHLKASVATKLSFAFNHLGLGLKCALASFRIQTIIKSIKSELFLDGNKKKERKWTQLSFLFLSQIKNLFFCVRIGNH